MSDRLHRQIYTAMSAALIGIATMVIPIPIPGGGYVNAGDIVILTSAFVLNPVSAMIAAGVGSAVADVCLGYALYVPCSMAVKAVMAWCAGTAFRGLRKKTNFVTAILVGGGLGEIIMTGGYFIYEGFVYGFAGAVAGILPNLLQGIVGILGAGLLYPMVLRIPAIKKIQL